MRERERESVCVTSYSFYFIICSFFILTYIYIYIYIYIYSLVLCFIAFYFFVYFFFLHFPLSGPVLTYISLLIIPCMIVYVTNNKEPCVCVCVCVCSVWPPGGLTHLRVTGLSERKTQTHYNLVKQKRISNL